MAASRLRPSFRHDGHIFFIYDHRVKTEEDDPSDAILYFYPASVTTEQQIAIVGGIIGITDFCLEFIPQSMPTIVKLNGHNFALLQHEEFIVGLAGGVDIPDSFLIGHMQFVWSTFVLYQGSLVAIKERVNEENFVKELNRVWDMYLPLCQIHSDPLSQAFKVLPYVQLHKSQGSLYLHASHILQRTLRYKGVVAGALFSWKKVLCSQLSNSLTRQLLLLMTQSQFPCVEANSVLELPGGVRLLHVFITDDEYQRLSHRRKKVYSRPSFPILTGPDLSLAGQPPQSSGHTGSRGEETVFTTYKGFQAGATGVIGQPGRGDVYSTASETVSGSSQAGWSFPQQESELSPAPGGGVTSGTDSEVFVDTLTEASFDQTQPTTAPVGIQDKGNTESKEGFFIPSQSRTTGLYVPPTGYASSSEPNTPEQRNLLVFAEVHNAVNLAQNTPSKNAQKNSTVHRASISDDVLVFGKSSGKPDYQKASSKSTSSVNDENLKTELDEHTFSSISNLKTNQGQEENSSGRRKPKVVEKIVDFIHPSLGKKKSQIVSKTVVPNGILPSAHSAEVSDDMGNSIDYNSDKKLPNTEGTHGVSNTEAAHQEPQTILNSGADTLDSLSAAPQKQSEGNLDSNFATVTDKNLPSDFKPHPNQLCGDQGAEPAPHEPSELVGTAEEVAPEDPNPACDKYQNHVGDNSCEANDHQKALAAQEAHTQREGGGDSDLGAIVPVQKEESHTSEIEDLVFQSQNKVEDKQLDTNKCSPNDSGEGEGLQAKETGTESKEEIISSSSSSRGSRNQSEEDSNIQQTMSWSKQVINVSLESKLSGDESSALSSSEQMHHNMDSSTLSLAPAGLGPSKMRLTFEASESDNSDTGIMSPMSEGGMTHENCLSPVEKSKTSGKKSFAEDGAGDYALRRLSSDYESRHVRGSSRASQGGKSADSSQSPASCEVKADKTGLLSNQGSARWGMKTSKLHKMTLYAQGHSDTLLLLLLSKNASCSKSYINSLWKTCLSHLAELDFEVKDAERHMKDESENIGAAYQYMRYDSFSQSLKGSALLPVSSLANEIVDTCVHMHETFEEMPDVQDITYRSHSACCFGHRAINTETYFQLGQPRNAAGICAQNDRTFSLDQLAGRILQNDVKISIL